MCERCLHVDLCLQSFVHRCRHAELKAMGATRNLSVSLCGCLHKYRDAGASPYSHAHACWHQAQASREIAATLLLGVAETIV